MGRKSVRDVLFKLIFENLFVESESSITYDEFVGGAELDFGGSVCSINDVDAENLEYFKAGYLSILKNKTDILNLVLGFGKDVVVLEPSWLIDELLSYQEYIVKTYKK